MDETVSSDLNPNLKRMKQVLLKKQELMYAGIKAKATKSLYLFNKFVLKAEQGDSSFVPLAPFHRQLCNFVTDRHDRKKLILVPRSHLKSKLITIGYSTFKIVQNPQIRILIYSATWQMAVDLHMSIQKLLESNEIIHLLWGNLAEGAREWSQDRSRLKDNDKREATITAAGIDNNLVGGHYDLIIMDDVVNRDNIGTADQMEKVLKKFRDSLDLLEPHGQLIVIGCLTGESLVLMGDGTWRNINKVKVGEEVFSYLNKKLVKRRVEAMIPQGKSVVYAVKTMRHRLKATDRHPFLTFEGEWKQVKELKKGDRIITISQVPIETSKRFYNKKFLKKDDFFLLGYLWGDGWLLKDRKRGVRGFCIARGVHDVFISYLKNWVKNYKEVKEGYYRIENKKIGNWLYANGFTGGAKTKRIPKWIFQTRTSYKRAFIDGILEADGSRIKGEGKRIELANKGLIEDLYWLSLTCGYRPTSVYHRQRFIQAPHSKEGSLHNLYSIGLTKNHRQAFGENQFTWRWERVESIEETGKEEVFDLTVQGTSNFIANGYVVHNTRWHDADLYGWIQEKDNSVYADFDVIVKRAFEGDLQTDTDFIPLWPGKFGIDGFKKLLRAEGWSHFSAQYLNDPVPEENATFRRDFFRYYDESDLRGRLLNKFLLIDPAISLRKEADYSAFVVLGYDDHDLLFILDIVRQRLSPNDIINMIFTLKDRWQVLDVGIEDVAFQRTLAYSLRDDQRFKLRPFHITELKPNERSKDQRIKGLQPLYENSKIYHNKLHPNNVYLEDELVRFPNGRHDDIIDALAYAPDIIYPARQKVQRRTTTRWLY